MNQVGILFFVKGIILGFSIAAPVGPIGVLCIRRTLARGFLNGFFSGLGTATADACYGSIAAFGVTVITSFLLAHQAYLGWVGGLFLLYLGYKTFQSRPAQAAAHASGQSLLGAYTSALFLTLTNPLTILSFAAVFAGLGIGAANGNYSLAVVLVFGVFVGSLLWWFLLSAMVYGLRAKFDPQQLQWVNRVSGIIIAGFGVISLMSI